MTKDNPLPYYIITVIYGIAIIVFSRTLPDNMQFTIMGGILIVGGTVALSPYVYYGLIANKVGTQ